MTSRMVQNAKDILNENKILIVVLIAGILMPFMVALLSHYVGGSRYTESISAYYYSVSRDLFVMALTLAGLLLISYPGREVQIAALRHRRCEYWISSLGGAMAFSISLFPMDRDNALKELGINGSDVPTRTFIEILFSDHARIHIISAMTFFVLAAVLSFLFSRETVARPSGNALVYCASQVIRGMTQGWSPRSPGLHYKLWGMVIIAGLLWAAVNISTNKEIYWPEVAMLGGFCGAWLTKLFVRLELRLTS